MLADLYISRHEHNRRTYLQMQDFPLTALDPLEATQRPLLEKFSVHGWNCIHLYDSSQQCTWPRLSGFRASHINIESEVPGLEELSLACVTRPDSLLNALSLHLSALKQLHVGLFRRDKAYSSPDVAKTLGFRAAGQL